MIDSDRKQFKASLKNCYLLKGYTMPESREFMEGWWRQLNPFPLDMVLAAFDRNVAENGFKPTPSEVLKHLPDIYGHPEPEEAFNLVPKSETDSGYVTDQMMAGLASAEDALSRGDMIAGRMAFIETYKKAVTAAKAQGQRAIFWYCQSTTGTREQRLETKKQHLIDAARKGWITSQSAVTAIENISNELGQESTPLMEQLLIIQNPKRQQLENGSKQMANALPPPLEPSDSISGKAKQLRVLIEFEERQGNTEAQQRLQEQLDQLNENQPKRLGAA